MLVSRRHKEDSMKKTALLLTLTMSAQLACERPEDGSSEEEARGAIPAAEDLEIDLPSGSSAKPALGEVSGAYLITLGTAVTLNGSVGLLLGIVRLIVAFPVTSIEGETYIWGPWHEEGKPSEYRLTVEHTGGGRYAWSLEARAVGQTGAFAAVVSGVTDGRGQRSGSITMDLDVAKTYDPASQGEGTIDASYDAGGGTRTLAIDAEKRVNGVLNTFHYEYEHRVDGRGSLQFMAFGDTEDPGAAEETVQWHAQWLATGAGRADAQITGGDLGAQTVSATECWNEWPLFRRVYYTDSVSWIPTLGLVSSCAIGN
jgi:hypothetical protein